jgi:hypothetical protein
MKILLQDLLQTICSTVEKYKQTVKIHSKEIKLKQIFLMIMLVIPLFAKMPNETRWITQIKPTDQEIVIHFINNKLNAYVGKELRAKAKSTEEGNEATLRNSLYKSALSNLATKNPILKEQLNKENKQLGEMYIYGNQKQKEIDKYNMLFRKTSEGFQRYSKSELQVVFNKYKKQIPSTINAIIQYVEQIIADIKSGKKEQSLAQKFADELQNMLEQNNGRIKVTSATYLISSFVYNDTVVINYQIIKKELIESVMKTRGFTYEQAINSIASSEFKTNATKMYPESLHKYYCVNKASADALSQGLTISINISFDDAHIVGPIEISKTSCLSYGY